MSEFSQVFLLDPQGNRLQTETLVSLSADRLLSSLMGLPTEEKAGASAADVLRTLESMQLMSRRGCAAGFQNLLPLGTHIESCFERFNGEFLESLSAVRMDFPIVYDTAATDIRELTKGYENDGRVFAVADEDNSLRLSYAADPGLFSWLRGRTLKSQALPHAIYSPTQGLRKWKRGELGAVNRLRQFTIPDVHVLALESQAIATYGDIVSKGAKGMRFWFNEQFAQFIDIEQDFLDRNPGLPAKLAAAAGIHTVVRVMPKRPRYYAMRSGLVVDAGFEHLMIYNAQYDDTSSGLFSIKTDTSEIVIVIHATAAMGLARVVPALVAQSLNGERPRALPAELVPTQVAILPTHERFKGASFEFARSLKSRGIGARIISNGSLGKRLSDLKKRWTPYAVIIGEKEENAGVSEVQCVASKARFPLGEILGRLPLRIAACQPPSTLYSYKEIFLYEN